MKIFLTINEEQYRALQELMTHDLQTNKSAYVGFLIANEIKRRNETATSHSQVKRPVGRPRAGKNADGEDTTDDLPDENAARTLVNPYPDLVPFADRKKKINEYELIMLEEKHKMHQSTKS